MEYKHGRNIYTVWEWQDAPHELRAQRPDNWEDRGAWIIQINPGEGFPYTEFPVHNRPDLDVVQTQIQGSWYAYIRDPRNIPWPPVTIEGFEFGELERLPGLNRFNTKINSPPKE